MTTTTKGATTTTTPDRVAFVGRMMSGKSSARTLLEREGYLGLALADQVKDDGIAMLNFARERHARMMGLPAPPPLTREEVERHKALFRPFWQWYGTEFWRDYENDQSHWIDVLGKKIADAEALGIARLVVDDCRFLNEVSALRSWGFTIIRVKREETAWAEAMLAKYGSPEAVEEVMGHKSEWLADKLPVDFEVLNDGRGFAALRRRLFDILDLEEVAA